MVYIIKKVTDVGIITIITNKIKIVEVYVCELIVFWTEIFKIYW